MNLENLDLVFWTEEKEKAEKALALYLEKESRRKRAEIYCYRYFAIGDDPVTLVEDVSLENNSQHNKIVYNEGNLEIERNIEYEEVEKLLSSH
ncbi:MAG: hypothetical protein BRC27_01400 [Nanohaloarchaea archaeon SW_10_44_10]|nr:MAG: hypothetical protein BRC27_01400 [Nanohaloarchaea archaeon SW_10_44_10]